MAGFRKASRAEQYLRMAVQGASGSGKTRSALEIAKHLAGPGGKIALIDSEKSAALYSDVVEFDVDDDFGPIGKENYHQDSWKKKLLVAAKEGYRVAILDSATHLWKGPGGFLSQIDVICANQRAKGQKGDSFAAWKTIDPLYMEFMQFIRALPMHVIFCIRAKTEYERESAGKGGLKKVGLSPEYRDNFEYEFDLQMAIDMDHIGVPLKHRLGDVLDGKVFPKPGKDFAEACLGWLASGAANAAKDAIEAEANRKAIEASVAAASIADPVKVATAQLNVGALKPMSDEKLSNLLPGYVDPRIVEKAPDTTRLTESSPTEQTAREIILERLAAAKSLDDLKAVSDFVKNAKADGHIDEAANKEIGVVYLARKKAIAA